MKNIIVTGGAGFIGSALCIHLVRDLGHRVINVDKLTYAGNLKNLVEIDGHPRYSFHKLDICDLAKIQELLVAENADGIIHLAAESHVDRSIEGPANFIETNIIGTFSLLEAARAYHTALKDAKKGAFSFHHV